MDYIIKFRTRYDLEAIKTYNRYNLNSKLTYKMTTILALLLIILAVVVNMNISLRIVSCVVGIIWLLEVIFLPTIRAKSAYKSSKLSKESIVEVEFKEENIFMITKKNEDIIATSVIEYDDVYKICNTNEYIYVYISNNQAILCSKKNMKGNYKKFIEMLKKQIGKKYKGK